MLSLELSNKFYSSWSRAEKGLFDKGISGFYDAKSSILSF